MRCDPDAVPPVTRGPSLTAYCDVRTSPERHRCVADRSVLASAGNDGTVRLWNLDGKAARMPFSAPLTGHDGPVRARARAKS